MSSKETTTPYWRLSGFYLFYFASLGALIPYWGVYLKSIGFGYAEIGELIAIVVATKVIAPNIWGWIADHQGKRMAIVRLGCALAVISFIAVFFVKTYWWLALVMFVFSFFWNAALPQFEATTMNYLGKDTHGYSAIRLWGSVGFVIAVAALGPLLDHYGAGLLPAILIALFTGIWLFSLLVPERAAGHLPLTHEPLMNVIRRPEVLAFLVTCFLMQASHGPYYTFYTIYMEDNGYSRSLVGQLWALGVVAEIGVFMVMHKLVPRFGLRFLILLSFVLTAIRWILTGLFVDNLTVMIGAQTLHAASFGIYHAVAIQLIHQYFTGKHQGIGQALYSSLSFGAGGAIGSLYAGYTWVSLGPTTTYLIAAGISLIALAVTWCYIRPAQLS